MSKITVFLNEYEININAYILIKGTHPTNPYDLKTTELLESIRQYLLDRAGISLAFANVASADS